MTNQILKFLSFVKKSAMKIEFRVTRSVLQIIASVTYEREWRISMKGNQIDGFESPSANLNGGDGVAHQYDDDGGYH